MHVPSIARTLWYPVLIRFSAIRLSSGRYLPESVFLIPCSRQYLERAPVNSVPPSLCTEAISMFDFDTLLNSARNRSVPFTLPSACFDGRPYTPPYLLCVSTICCCHMLPYRSGLRGPLKSMASLQPASCISCAPFDGPNGTFVSCILAVVHSQQSGW